MATRLEALIKALQSLGGTPVEDTPEENVIAKSVDTEQRKCLEVLFEASPDVENPKRDAHNNWYTAETIVKAQASYEKNTVPSNLFHMVETEAFEVQDTLILAEDTTYDNGVTVNKGSLLGWVHYIDDELWEVKKEKGLGGMSPAFYGTTDKETGEITNVGFSVEDHLKMVNGEEFNA